MTMRVLTAEEAAIVRRMLDFADAPEALRIHLDGALVAPMEDGGMGSIRFASSQADRRAIQIAQGRGHDSDGVVLEIALNLDQHGDLFELDIWRVDFAPIRRHPRAEEIEAT